MQNLTKPLTDLSKKNAPFDWKVSRTPAFNDLKHALTTDPVLVVPDPGKPFELVCDASGFGIGAVLCCCRIKGLLPIILGK